MTYPVGPRNKGWLWEHRAIAAAVCIGVIALGAILAGSGLVPFPVGPLMIVANVVAFLVLVVLVLLWLSTTASGLPHDAKPTI